MCGTIFLPILFISTKIKRHSTNFWNRANKANNSPSNHDTHVANLSAVKYQKRTMNIFLQVQMKIRLNVIFAVNRWKHLRTGPRRLKKLESALQEMLAGEETRWNRG